jgi:hypothetical protein
MTSRPRPVLPSLRVDNPSAALDYELAREKASALGRMGRRLEAALAALAAFDARADEDPLRRDALVAEAGAALWNFIVQREACGLRDSTRAMRDYGVPGEVRARMGVLPARRERPAGSRR